MRIKLHCLPLILAAAASSVSAERWRELDGCEITAPGRLLSAQARCGELEVAENPADPEGRRISLAYAVVPARVSNPEPDPVVFLAGGPGQSARGTLPFMRLLLRDVNRTRDLIFLDQRGTGGSNILDCEFSEVDAFVTPDWEEFDAELRECVRQWDAEVRFYTTAHGADDLELLRAHLGFKQLNLVGGSYGTRLAQAYLRRYPERVRSVTLDGLVPTRLVLGSEHAEKLDRSLEKLFAACAADPPCAAQFPDLHGAFRELKAMFAGRQQTVQVTDPRTGIARELEFSGDTLAGALRFLAYQPESQMKIPYLVHEAAATGDPTRLASQLLMVMEDMEDMIAIGLNFVVGCSEDWPNWPADLDSSGTLLGNAMAELYARVCAWWPAGEADPDFHRPFDSDVPVLILSGELDPVTPPEYGEEARAQFSNSKHIVAAGRGHMVLTNHCIRSIAAEFIERASVRELDTACLDTVGPEPFFLNLLGPPP